MACQPAACIAQRSQRPCVHLEKWAEAAVGLWTRMEAELPVPQEGFLLAGKGMSMYLHNPGHFGIGSPTQRLVKQLGGLQWWWLWGRPLASLATLWNNYIAGISTTYAVSYCSLRPACREHLRTSSLVETKVSFKDRCVGWGPEDIHMYEKLIITMFEKTSLR